MEIKYKKYINTDKINRIEFLLIDYDYIDGNEYLARLFHKEYGFIVDEKIDGCWYSIIRIHLDSSIYELVWHEDTGNLIYSVDQDDNSINTLEQRLKIVLGILNEKFDE